MVPRKSLKRTLPLALLALSLSAGCNGKDNAEEDVSEVDLSSIPVPPANGPRLASVDKATPVYARPAVDAPKIGLMRAGATVARAEEPIGTEGCPGGWYPVHPRGFVCAGQGATTNLAHPTLAVMKTLPARQGPLPYRYFRAKKETHLYEWDRAKGAAVREVGKLRSRSRVAVVGSWSAKLPDGAAANLAMLPDGRFVNAEHFEQSDGSDFKGTVLDQTNQLPVAYVVKTGIRYWDVDGKTATKGDRLDKRTMIPLTGRFRTINSVKFWATADGRYVRHPDVTTIRRRDGYPDFVTVDQRWIDVSIITGTMVLYEGKKPVYATLCSVGHDRLGDPETGPTTQMGTFAVTAKHLTTSEPGKKPFAENHDVFDTPWAQMMESGQMIHGSMWHGRFGIEHGPGNIQLSPADAAYVFAWTTPFVPEGWHSVLQLPETESKVLVHIRK